MPREYWDHSDGERPDQKPDWHPRYGDRVQTLVFIAQKMDETAIRSALDACLLDESLALDNSEAWASLRNPFPELILEAEEEE